MQDRTIQLEYSKDGKPVLKVIAYIFTADFILKGRLRSILKDKRVRFYIGIDALKNMSGIENIDNIMIYNPSLKVLPNKYDKVEFIF
ncbi:hypothetical protein [Clostridium kluyveri]|uniref:Uncharacterized protein n=2 Tax=Clostridium kluyveri TaxID=1534 RepID=A5MZ12_CLOK5|nr:hypothetical protein [Clostridium kluyveri]EDK34108.1 Hypothetical protein CKL_2096 [Clostridium kluyveri DSM 555]BAH06886.1 hypothetical protein CKR_1835 [Clostridium kluyveri NBRC 12016]